MVWLNFQEKILQFTQMMSLSWRLRSSEFEIHPLLWDCSWPLRLSLAQNVCLQKEHSKDLSPEWLTGGLTAPLWFVCTQKLCSVVGYCLGKDAVLSVDLIVVTCDQWSYMCKNRCGSVWHANLGHYVLLLWCVLSRKWSNNSGCVVCKSLADVLCLCLWQLVKLL